MSEVRIEESDSGPNLANDHLRVTVHLNRGTFDVIPAHSTRPALRGASAAVVLADGRRFAGRGSGLETESVAPIDDTHGRGLELRLSRERDEGEPELTITLALYEDHPFLVVTSALGNRGQSPLRIASFEVVEGAHIEMGSGVNAWRMYKEGWQNWSPALVLPLSGEDIFMAPPVIGPASQPAPRPGLFVSEMVTVVADTALSRAVMVGFISNADQFSQLWVDRDAESLSAVSYADRISLAPGEHLASERLLLDLTADPIASLRGYGNVLAGEMSAIAWPRPVTGWCSWYYYWQGVNEDEFFANLDELAARRDEIPIEYVQLDDGWQAGIGDWTDVNVKFPSGLHWLVDRIHERGFKAGLWFAPFMVGTDSKLWQEHPEWVVQHKSGRPYVAMLNWGQRCYGLDLTRADVIEWLERVALKIFDEWGFDYVKIDFLYAGAVDGIRHDPELTRAQAYRRGIETIRRIAGERFILGCGHPIGPSIGVVNGSRISPDVAPFWYPMRADSARDPSRTDMSNVSTLNAIRNTLNRFWMHDRLWLNDPDCLLARDSETALTEDEVRALATVIGMSGGMVLNSDSLTRLTEDRREILSMLLPVYGKTATPLDMFESDMPQVLELDCGAHRMLALFNWDSQPAEVSTQHLDGQWHVFDVWMRQYLGVHIGGVAFTAPRHGCRLLRLTPAVERRAIVGTTFHLLQGACEIVSEVWHNGVLSLKLKPVAKRHGALYVHAPEAMGAPKVKCDSDVQTTDCGNGTWRIALTLDRQTDIRIESRESQKT